MRKSFSSVTSVLIRLLVLGPFLDGLRWFCPTLVLIYPFFLHIPRGAESRRLADKVSRTLRILAGQRGDNSDQELQFDIKYVKIGPKVISIYQISNF